MHLRSALAARRPVDRDGRRGPGPVRSGDRALPAFWQRSGGCQQPERQFGGGHPRGAGPAKTPVARHRRRPRPVRQPDRARPAVRPAGGAGGHRGGGHPARLARPHLDRHPPGIVVLRSEVGTFRQLRRRGRAPERRVQPGGLLPDPRRHAVLRRDPRRHFLPPRVRRSEPGRAPGGAHRVRRFRPRHRHRRGDPGHEIGDAAVRPELPVLRICRPRFSGSRPEPVRVPAGGPRSGLGGLRRPQIRPVSRPRAGPLHPAGPGGQRRWRVEPDRPGPPDHDHAALLADRLVHRAGPAGLRPRLLRRDLPGEEILHAVRLLEAAGARRPLPDPGGDRPRRQRNRVQGRRSGRRRPGRTQGSGHGVDRRGRPAQVHPGRLDLRAPPPPERGESDRAGRKPGQIVLRHGVRRRSHPAAVDRGAAAGAADLPGRLLRPAGHPVGDPPGRRHPPGRQAGKCHAHGGAGAERGGGDAGTVSSGPVQAEDPGLRPGPDPGRRHPHPDQPPGGDPAVHPSRASFRQEDPGDRLRFLLSRRHGL